MKNRINILAVSDEPILHDAAVKQRHPNIDLILGCGDLRYDYLDFLTSALDKRMFYVLGNHDKPIQKRSRLEVGVFPPPPIQHHGHKGVRGGRNIHRQCVKEKNLLIAGFEGSVRYKPNAPSMFTQNEMTLFVMQMLPRFVRNRARYGRSVDIVITHAPPWDIHAKDDPPHYGFKAFLQLMRWFRPRYLLHGHIHRPDPHIPQRTTYHDTTVINVFPTYVLDIEP